MASDNSFEQMVLARQKQQQAQVLPTERQPPNPATIDPQQDALQHPEISPEEVIAGGVAGPLARGAIEAGPAIAKGAGNLLADEAGMVPLYREGGLEPLQQIQKTLGHEVTPPGHILNMEQAQKLLADAQTALATGNISPVDFARVSQHYGRSLRRGYAEGGEVAGPEASPTPDTVNLLNPEGQLVSVPQEHLQSALTVGYSHPSPEQVTAHFRHEDYGGAGQQAIAGLEGVAQGVLGPLAPAAERLVGVSPEGMRGREEENPVTHGVGEAIGFAGPAVVSMGASGAARLGVSGAAELASRAAGLQAALPQAALLGKVGEAVGTATALGKAGSGFIEQVGADAIKAAFETAVYQGGEELSNRVKGYPEEGAGSALAHMGMAGVMGGVFGGALGAALRKTGVIKEAASELSGGSGELPEGVFVSASERPKLEAGDLKAHVEFDPSIKPAKKEALLEAINLGKPKENAAEIKAAQELLGAPETPGMLLGSPLAQMQVDTLANSPYTYSGGRVRTALDEAYSYADSALQGAVKSTNGLSKDELGQSLQASLTQKTRDAYAPVKAAFAELETLYPSIPVELEDIGAFREGLKSIKEVALGPATDEGKIARQVVSALQNAKTAEDLSIIRNMSVLKKSGVGADPLGRIKGILRDRLQTMQDEAVAKYADSFPRNDEAGALMHTLVEADHAAKQAYKPYIRKVQELSEWLGKGKIHGTEDALNFMNERLSASDVSKKLFTASKDPAFLKFFSKEFPEEFSLIRDYQRMDYMDKVKTGDDFSAKRFFNNYNKMEPELQKALYTSEEMKKVSAAETYIRDAFPKSYNPSGTSHVTALRAAYETPKSIILANARDYAMEQVIKRASPRALQASELGRATVSGNKMADSAVKAVMNGDKELSTNLAPTQAQRDKLSKMVDTLHADPSKMLQAGDNNPIPQYAQAFAAMASRAVMYLAGVKPNTTPSNPLDTKHAASPFQQSKYNRALDIVQQPLNVMVRMKQGTMTQDDVKTLKTVYPAVYQSLSSKIMSQVMDKVEKGESIPYKTRLQLSMFLGQPLDSTMTQAGIATVQAQSAQKAAAQASATAKPPAASSVKGLDNVAKQAQTPGQSRQAARAKRTD